MDIYDLVRKRHEPTKIFLKKKIREKEHLVLLIFWLEKSLAHVFAGFEGVVKMCEKMGLSFTPTSLLLYMFIQIFWFCLKY